MEKQPLVSIIVPTYNAAAYIRETVDSALAQTYKNIEIIVVDDGSKDNTREVLEPYIAAGTIQYYFQKNTGLPGARNTALEKSKGEFITLLDSDDLFLPNKVERQVAYFIAYPECDVCYCDYVMFYDGEPSKLYKVQRTYYSGSDVFPNLLRQNYIGCIAMMFRRNVIDRIGPFSRRIIHAEDWEFTLRAAYHGMRFDFLPEMLSKYRIRRNSLSHDAAQEIIRKKTVMKIFEMLWDDMTPADREKYDMKKILFLHRTKLWYAEFEQYLPPLRWYREGRQGKSVQPIAS